MVNKDDIGKQCFLKCKIANSDHYTWENVGARIQGVAPKQNKIIVKMPHGELVGIEWEDVRVLEPRPV